MHLPAAGVSQLVLSPDRPYRSPSAPGGSVWLWDLRPGREAAELSHRVGGEVTGLAFSADSRTLAVASQDLLVRLWDVGSRTPVGGPLAAAEPEAVEVTPTVAFSRDGRVLASRPRVGPAVEGDPLA